MSLQAERIGSSGRRGSDSALLAFLALASAVTLVLLAGCGGRGDNGAQVEANLRHYLNTLNPQPSGFPVGAGPPRVKENSCKKVAKDHVGPGHGPGRPRASWSCVVRFGHTPFHVLVALKAGGEVAWVMPLPRHVLRPAGEGG